MKKRGGYFFLFTTIIGIIIGVSAFFIVNGFNFGLAASSHKTEINWEVSNLSRENTQFKKNIQYRDKENTQKEQFLSTNSTEITKKDEEVQETELPRGEGVNSSDPDKEEEVEKFLAYLTFDDGPSPNTLKILQILDDYGIKATFFVTGQAAEKYPQIVQRIAAAGHTLGNHSYSHNYKLIYGSPESFMEEIEKTDSLIFELIGKKTELVRFPGGSYPKADERYFRLLEEGGYYYFDWNVDSGDALKKKIRPQEIINNVMKQVKGKTKPVILMHDSGDKQSTVEALPQIIQNLKVQGFEFAPLSKEVTPVRFKVKTIN
ncbi:MAG TPA: polysaccharide deacetylase [Clostridia bacterium]|nr:polysaccharide deacetylase [Clostridia bacterium]